MKAKTFIMPLILIIGLTSCGPKPGTPEASLILKKEDLIQNNKIKSETVSNIPDWCLNLPRSDYATYQCGIGISSDLNLSRTRAVMNGKALLVDSIKSVIMSKIDNYAKTTGTQENEVVKKRLEIVSRNLIPETTLVGYKQTQSKVFNENGKFRFYTLLEYPIGDANKALLNQIKQDEVLSTQKDADKAMADLEAEIEKRKKK